MGAEAQMDGELSPASRARLEDLRFVGALTQVDANARDAELRSTSHGADAARDRIELTVLVADGKILDAKYRSLATGGELVLYDLMAEAIVGLSLDEAAALTVGAVRGRLGEDAPAHPLGDDQAFPILLKAAGGTPPAPTAAPGAAAEDAGEAKVASAMDWDQVGLFEKVRRIETVLDDQVRPMLATDGGGIELVDLREQDLVVQYNGACGSCSSSIGGTMVFIEDTLEGALGIRLKLVVQGMDEPEPFLDL
jgi:NifU-like protein